MTAALRTRPRRIQGRGPRIQRPPRRPELVDPGRRSSTPSSAARRSDCAFDDGLYLNPGPWRIPYHHHAILDYCRRFGVALEPFIQLNHNAYLHSTTAFGGKPQRIREIKADFEGAIAELLAKATRTGRARRSGVEGGPGDPARGAARPWRPRQRLPLPSGRRCPRSSAATPGIPAAASTARPSTASRSGCTIS